MSYQLLSGDCLDKMRDIPDGSVDAIICDPPYGTTNCRWDTVIDLPAMWEQIRRVRKPGAAVVMTACQPFTSALIMSNPKEFRHHWIWEKNKATGHLNAKRAPMRAHEDVVVFAARQPSYCPQMTDGHKPGNAADRIDFSSLYGKQRRTQYGGATVRYPRSVQRFDIINNDDPGKQHPTQKPVALMEYLIRTYTCEGEVVLDFAMGSGTTGAACINTGRDFIGIELDAHCFAVAEQRLAHAISNRGAA